MKLFVKLEGVEELLARLRRGAEAATSGTARTVEAYRQIGALECEAQRMNYVDRSRGGTAGGVKWRGLSPLTALLRRSGATKKLPGWAALVDLAATLPIMVNTGRLLASLAPGAPGNVLAPGGTSVTFGMSVEYAEKMHAGGPSDAPMIANREDADATVSRRILKVLPGRKAKGKGRNWNREFFQIRGWLRNRVGVIATVSARPVLTLPPQDRLDGYAGRVKAAIVEDLRR